MNRVWTTEQQNAINSRGGSLLVSAAAGSGKTSVLVQRVIEKITDKSRPIDIDKFLIVTFTNAAAHEMRTRISDKLSQMITQNPGNINLHRQQMLLKRAYIGTIHSFCGNIVRENFFRLGISSKFRIGDESEISLIKHKASENTLEHFYTLGNPEFKILVDILGTEKDDSGLSNVINQIYEFTRSIPFPEKWMHEKLEMYDTNSYTKNPWEKVIFDYSFETIGQALEESEKALKLTAENPEIQKAYGPALLEDFEKIKSIVRCFEEQNWDEICKQLGEFTFAKLKPLKTSENDYIKNLILLKRDHAKSILKKVRKYFCFNKNELLENTKYMHLLVKTLFDVVKHFSREVYSQKLVKNIADFSDLEHWTLELLTTRGSEKEIQKSALAQEISNRYEEIMVDEYQDINEIQDTIFKMITKNETNIFMVGDVKQSIYKFRQSRPQIFLEKKSRYSIFDSQNPKYPSKIILGKNFRSSQGIIEGINFIFECLMSQKTGEIDYTNEEMLIPGADYECALEPDISLKIIDVSSCEEDTDIIEAQTIAKTITKMIFEGYTVGTGDKKRPVTYGDFCILLRSSNSHAHIYARELHRCGIPSWSETREKFLKTSEISTIISLLKIINNPVQDVYLIASLMGTLFGFTVDELSEIRKAAPKVPFYFALKKFSENRNNKITNFFQKIDKYRNLVGIMSCDELIDYIYSDTDLPALYLALKGGKQKKANLLLLVDYARKFENQSHGGLGGFLRFIDAVERKNSDLSPASVSSETENTVKIMSIHKAKGLESPVCILAGCSRKFNFDNNSVVLHPQLGIGMKLKNQDGTIRYDNLIRQALCLKNRQEDLSEELRILYVALTRAKQKLILISSLKDPQKVIEKNLILSDLENKIPPYTVQSASSFSDWILMCISKSSLKNKLCRIVQIPTEISCFENNKTKNLEWEIELMLPDKDNEEKDLSENILLPSPSPLKINKAFEETIKKRFNFEYPYKELANLPLKISASKLAESQNWKDYIASSKPSFATAQNMSPAQIGDAMHKFMCHADFKKVALSGVATEIDLLFIKGFLSKEEINALNVVALQKFFKCNLLKRMIKSPKILKEHRFSVNVELEELLGEKKLRPETESSVIIQGAIDCAFIENNQYVIVDYKTDRTKNVKELYEKYSKQLETYKYALENTENIKVKELVVYSFFINDYFTSN